MTPADYYKRGEDKLKRTNIYKNIIYQNKWIIPA